MQQVMMTFPRARPMRLLVKSTASVFFCLSDFPLGHSAGKPHDEDSQMRTLEGALSLLETATQPRTTIESAQIWSEDASWKNDFLNIERLSAEEITMLREDYKKQREAAAMLKNSTKD